MHRGQVLLLHFERQPCHRSDVRYMGTGIKGLVSKHPEIARQIPSFHDICPATHVGSSQIDDYPRSIEDLALSVYAYAPRFKAKDRAAASSESSNVGTIPAEIPEQSHQGSLFPS
jgi:hypothetical protein